MSKFKLIPYTIQVREKGEKNKYFNLDEIDFFEFLVKAIKYYSIRNRVYHDKDNKKILKCANIHVNKQEKYIFGTLECGEYGYRADFRNIKTDEILYNLRTEDLAEMLPYHFFIKFGEAQLNNMSFLLLQSTFNKSVKLLFEKALKYHFLKQFGFAIMEISWVLSDEDSISKLINAESLFKITFTRKLKSREITNRIEADNYEDITETRTFHISRKKNILLTRGRERLAKQLRNRVTEFLIINDIHYDSGSLKIYDGREEHTISLIDLVIQKRKTILEAEVKLEGGHPTLESMKHHAEEYFTSVMYKYSEN